MREKNKDYGREEEKSTTSRLRNKGLSKLPRVAERLADLVKKRMKKTLIISKNDTREGLRS